MTGNPQWRLGWEPRFYLRTAVAAGFLAACCGLLAVISLRGYTIYG
jgi:hypothetical protein